jgi:hypothetical protein
MKTKHTPVLLLSRRDLDRLVRDTHPGALGQDHGPGRWVRPSGRPFRRQANATGALSWSDSRSVRPPSTGDTKSE